MNGDFRRIFFPGTHQPHPHPTSRSSGLGEKRVSGREGSRGRSPNVPEHEPRPSDSRGCLRRRSLFPRALSLPPQESWSQMPGSQSEPVHRGVRTSDSFLRPPASPPGPAQSPLCSGSFGFLSGKRLLSRAQNLGFRGFLHTNQCMNRLYTGSPKRKYTDVGQLNPAAPG